MINASREDTEDPICKRISKYLARLFLLIIIGLVTFYSSAYAIPTLQLDIEGGTYDSTTQTIIAPGNPFTLYALLIPNLKNTLTDYYYISAAIVPKLTQPGGTLGTFSLNGDDITKFPGNGYGTVAVTGEMVYGVPPLETIVTLQGWDKGDLPRHGIYETYFAEFEFQFNSNQISPYNTQDRAISGGLIPTSGNGMYYVTFNVDTANLVAGYEIHFDLYNTKLKSGVDIDVTQFAPFSHDAEGRKVTEPSTLLLLGSGLLGLGLLGRKIKR